VQVGEHVSGGVGSRTGSLSAVIWAALSGAEHRKDRVHDAGAGLQDGPQLVPVDEFRDCRTRVPHQP